MLHAGDASDKRPRGFTPGGASLLWEKPAGKGGHELWELGMTAAASPRRLLAGPLEGSTLSPDGAWLAYQSGEIGSIEVFVRRQADRSRTVQVSTEGGRSPCWPPDGRELFYLCEDRMFAASFEDGEGRPSPGKARLVFQRDGIEGYCVLPGSNGFIVVERVPGQVWCDGWSW